MQHAPLGCFIQGPILRQHAGDSPYWGHNPQLESQNRPRLHQYVNQYGAVIIVFNSHCIMFHDLYFRKGLLLRCQKVWLLIFRVMIMTMISIDTLGQLFSFFWMHPCRCDMLGSKHQSVTLMWLMTTYKEAIIESSWKVMRIRKR